jgi:GntR family transcriptional regulator
MPVHPPTLDQHSAQPLYAQLIDHFRRLITSGELKPGDRFPAELDLMKQYGVARITVRRAMSELVREGLLVRARAKGSFVASPKIERELHNLASFSERMQARGLRAGSKVVQVGVMPATPRIAEALELAEGSPVAEIQRVRYANDEPTALETSYLSLERCPGIEREDFNRQSLYQVLETKYGLRPASARRTLELTFTTNRESKLLQIAPRAPLFLMMAIVSADDGTIVEYAKILFRGDRFRFQI